MEIVRANPPLKVLDLSKVKFSTDQGQEICAALTESRIVTLTTIDFEKQKEWFDNSEMWSHFCSFFAKQTSLSFLYLRKCKIDYEMEADLKVAFKKFRFKPTMFFK